MVGRAQQLRRAPLAARRVEEDAFARWLAYATALHAGALLVAALARVAPRSSSTPHTTALAATSQFLDIVEDPPRAHITPTLEGAAAPWHEPAREAATFPAPQAQRQRELKGSTPDAPKPPGGDPARSAARGLDTISGGTRVWAPNIPHHLGKITGSRHGGVAVWGKMPEVSIRRRVGEHSPSILRCYSEGLSSVPNLAGRAVMRFVIERDGHVQRVNTLGSDFPSKSVLRCLERLFREIRFPEPDLGTVTVTYPLPLSSAQVPDWASVP